MTPGLFLTFSVKGINKFSFRKFPLLVCVTGIPNHLLVCKLLGVTTSVSGLSKTVAFTPVVYTQCRLPFDMCSLHRLFTSQQDQLFSASQNHCPTPVAFHVLPHESPLLRVGHLESCRSCSLSSLTSGQ